MTTPAQSVPVLSERAASGARRRAGARRLLLAFIAAACAIWPTPGFAGPGDGVVFGPIELAGTFANWPAPVQTFLRNHRASLMGNPANMGRYKMATALMNKASGSPEAMMFAQVISDPSARGAQVMYKAARMRGIAATGEAGEVIGLGRLFPSRPYLPRGLVEFDVATNVAGVAQFGEQVMSQASGKGAAWYSMRYDETIAMWEAFYAKNAERLGLSRFIDMAGDSGYYMSIGPGESVSASELAWRNETQYSYPATGPGSYTSRTMLHSGKVVGSSPEIIAAIEAEANAAYNSYPWYKKVALQQKRMDYPGFYRAVTDAYPGARGAAASALLESRPRTMYGGWALYSRTGMRLQGAQLGISLIRNPKDVAVGAGIMGGVLGAEAAAYYFVPKLGFAITAFRSIGMRVLGWVSLAAGAAEVVDIYGLGYAYGGTDEMNRKTLSWINCGYGMSGAASNVAGWMGW